MDEGTSDLQCLYNRVNDGCVCLWQTPCPDLDGVLTGGFWGILRWPWWLAHEGAGETQVMLNMLSRSCYSRII